jgi:hypothetical protein
MILGYLDKEDRAYDLNFATLRLRIRIETEPSKGSSVSFARVGEEGGARYRIVREGTVTAAVAMDHGGHSIPLLRPVLGHLYRHERGLLFVADPPKRDPEDPTFFLVKLRAMPTAVKFFFEDQEGTELVSIPDDEVIGVESRDSAAVVSVSAASLALPNEKLSYAFELTPRKAVSTLLEGLSRRPGKG